ncbi:unnamed protein product [Bursaphelenchus okinawaensis]|uniref:E3 ubiquitin-protein ligase n=1 Tax=Bursaphelenchus okinawaensis TaxID=465554 RepID=A0A811L1G4_9BILA|nr:unnamed protein product [Bursaphelenchus okinawaensis]CAG9115191.1 unnamed protein product [Bursaphelenchus okinawaensis]
MEGIDPDTLLEWLQTGAGEERDLQLMALEQLCMLLLMSDNIDRCFESCPPRSFIPALCRIFVDETAPENVLEVTARAITYYLDVSNECTRRITQVEGAVKAICHRLTLADMTDRTSKDLAEQCVKLLESVCQRETPAVYEAGGLQSMLILVGNNGSVIHKDTLYSAMSVVQRLCSRVEPNDNNLKDCAADLGKLLTHEDLKVAESALRCFAALTDRFIRKNIDPTELTEPSNLIEHLLNALMPTSTGAEGMSTNKSISFISIVLSLLSNLCRGSHKVTTQVISSEKLVPAMKNICSSKDERCVLDALRLVDLLVLLMCEGRASLPRGSGISSSDSLSGSSSYDKSHRFLIDAIRQRDTDALIDAFEHGSVDPNFTDDAGQTLLNWCAAFGTLDMVQYLCDKGADVNRGQRSSSLHYAACFGRVDIVTALLRNGANPELRDEEGRTALDKARERADDSHQQVIQILESPSSYMASQEERATKPEPIEVEETNSEQTQIDQTLSRKVIQRLIPVFCHVCLNSMVSSVKKAALGLIGKCVQNCSAEAFDELVQGKFTTEGDDGAFVDGLTKVLVMVLNEEDNTEGHEYALKILLSVLEKNPEFWVDELVRLGVVERVEQLANREVTSVLAAESSNNLVMGTEAATSSKGTNGMDSGSILHQDVTSEINKVKNQINEVRSILNDVKKTTDDGNDSSWASSSTGIQRSHSGTPARSESQARSDSVQARSDSAQTRSESQARSDSTQAERQKMLNIPVQSEEEFLQSQTPSPTPENGQEVEKKKTEKEGNDSWVLEVKVLYKWNDWRLMRSTDSLYVWCDAVAIELSDASNGWLRFFLDGKLSTMYSSGVPETGPDNAETRSDFIRKFQLNRNAMGGVSVVPKPIFSSPANGKTIESGNWVISSSQFDELIIKNQEGGQQKVVIKDDFPGFQYETSKFSTKSFMAESTLGSNFVTGWAARGGERRLKFRTEAQKQRINELAKELWDKHLKEARNKPRDIFVQLRNASQELVDVTKLCAQNQADQSNFENLVDKLRAVRDFVVNERLLSTFELATSGVIEAILTFVSTALEVRNGVVAQVFKTVFENEVLLSSMVHRIVDVLESVEKFSQHLYDAPGGSANGLQLLTRRLRFSMEQLNTTCPSQSELLNRTGRVLKTEPLTTVGQVKTFLHRMVAKMWYDFPRESMEFVRKINNGKNDGRDPIDLKYESDFDTNGLIWYLGTNALTQSEWINPAAVGVLHITSSDGSKLPYGCYEDMLSRDVNPLNCHTSDNKDMTITMDLGVMIAPTAYTLRHSRGYGKSALRTWDLEGSIDGKNYVLLVKHENETALNDAGSTATFFIPENEAASKVRYLRIRQRGPNSSTVTHYISISGFEVYGKVYSAIGDSFSPVHPKKHSTKKKYFASLEQKMRKDKETPLVTVPGKRAKLSKGFGRTQRVNSTDSNSSIPGAIQIAQSCALNPATVATALANNPTTPSQGSPNSIHQKSMSTTNLLDVTPGKKSVSATQQASSAECLQRQSPSLENLLSRSRVHGDRRIPEVVPENDALDEYSSRESHIDSASTATHEENKNLSASTPELNQPEIPPAATPEAPATDATTPAQPKRQLYNGIVDLYQEMVKNGQSIEDVDEMERYGLSSSYVAATLDEIMEADDIENYGFEEEFQDEEQQQDENNPKTTLASIGQGIKSKIGNFSGTLKNIVAQAVEPTQESSLNKKDSAISSHLEEFFEELFADDDEECEEDFSTSLPGTEGSTLERLASIAPLSVNSDLVDRFRRPENAEAAGPSTTTPQTSATTTSASAPLRINWRNLLRGSSSTDSSSSNPSSSSSKFTAIPLRSELVRLLAESTSENSLQHDVVLSMLDAAGLRALGTNQHRSNTGGRNSRKPTRNWDDEYVLRRQFHALIPAFDPRPGRNNVNQTSDMELPPKDVKLQRNKDVARKPSQAEPKDTEPLEIYLRGPNINGVENATIRLDDSEESMFSAVQRLVNLTNYVSKNDRPRKIWEPSYTLLYQNATSDPECHVEVTKQNDVDDLNSEKNVIVKQCLDTLQAFHELSEDHASTDSFVSYKLTQKLTQELTDPLIVSAKALPTWCEMLVYKYSCLFTMETRSMFMNATAFGTSRAIVWLQNRRDNLLEEARTSASASGSNQAGVRREDHYPEYRVGRIKHERIKVHRDGDELFDNATRVMKFHAARKAILEIEYLGEEGTGLGPTLEFYALVAAEFQRKSLAMWLCDDSDENQMELEKGSLDLGEGKKPPGFYVRRAGGLFPASAPQHSAEAERIADLFRILGVFLAKVLQDGRLVDLPLSLPFLKLLISDSVAGKTDSDFEFISLDGLLNLDDLEQIHPHKARFLRAVQRLCQEKAQIRMDKFLSPEDKAKQINNLRLKFNGIECSVEDLNLTFVLNPPSAVFKYSEHELIPNGASTDVTVDNIELYLGKCVDFYLNSGIRKQVTAFREGFDFVFPLRSLKPFSAIEVQKLLSGEQCPEWTRDDLINYTEPKLGYTKESVGFLRFVDVVAEMTADERKAFLQFTTGCSSLPPGGLANLHPRLTIVRKVDGGGDGSYPSVNTCVHYLKLPEYSSTEVLRERLLAATSEKGFHLN